MTRISFENLPSTSTPLNATNVNKLNNVVISSTEPNTNEEVWMQKGKNLFDKNPSNYDAFWDGGATGKISLLSNGTIQTIADYQNWRAKAIDIKKIKPNTTYTLSITLLSSTSSGTLAVLRVPYYNGSASQYVAFDGSNSQYSFTAIGKQTFTFTTPSNMVYIGLSLSSYGANTNAIFGDIMLEENATATTYEPYIDKKIYIKNDNNGYDEFYDENQIKYGSIKKYETTTQSALKTVASASYVVMDGLNQAIDTKKENSTILVFITVGGIYNNNTGYEVGFNVQMDNSINSTSGSKGIGGGDYRTNWSTDGSSKILFKDVFVFTNVSKGNHSFKILWSSGNANVTAYCGNYGHLGMTIVEL